MYTHEKQIIQTGKLAAHAKKAVVLLHGRGSTAQGILSLQRHLHVEDALLFAPQATNNSWYPYSFLAPVANNQPALDSGLALLDEVVAEAAGHGITPDQLYFVGFSQGACLTLEYVARRAKRYGGVIAFTGGLIGETLNMANYQGNFDGTPILITAGDNDPHVPLYRIGESVVVLREMGADVKMEIYPQKPHSISADETLLANEFVLT
ncbi:dienelactone hydrolase family protein [Parapedobacter sp. ISTM3]|uniref:alpha/beta hydrolase n=1 Tax=Parapedobacter sp. ISTM3 TaxID=2800130 RepID=UPI0019067A5D|nr:dienelactone hydrolase family protein [Parapedobacter sp. ISTM3]MBK1438524.1 dienelactone hydrolase family protein [Parapedobacter sp. ISTM3]